MIETLHKRHSLFSRAANHFRIAMTAMLALALGIGVNAAIFNLEGLRYAGDINTAPLNLFSRSDLRDQMAEAATSNNAERGRERGASAEISDNSLEGRLMIRLSLEVHIYACCHPQLDFIGSLVSAPTRQWFSREAFR